MELVTILKYEQNIELKDKILSIKEDIVEENCWDDRFWGTVDGIGENNLGIILMQYRDANKS